MKKILSLLLLSSIAFCAVFNSSVDSSTNKDMIYRMNYQNTDGSRGAYVNTTVPKLGWLNLNGYTTAPVTANMVTGNAVLYYDYTATDPVLKVWFKDVSGNVTSQEIGATTNVLYSFASTAALTNATASGTLTVTGATALNGGLTMDTNKFTVADTSGNTAIGGTLGVTGATTLTGALNANGGIACDTNKFTVADTSGNTAIAGTLGVTGITSVSTINVSTAISFPATSSVTVSTGNVNIPVLVGGVTYYIKANTAE